MDWTHPLSCSRWKPYLGVGQVYTEEGVYKAVSRYFYGKIFEKVRYNYQNGTLG